MTALISILQSFSISPAAAAREMYFNYEDSAYETERER